MSEKKAATIIDVANRAGVSKATVGRVIGNYGNVSLKSRQKVLQAIEELGYSPNAIAQGLRAKSTRTIGVVVDSITNNFCNQLLSSVERVALQKGYDVLFGNSSGIPGREYEVLSNLKARRVNGVVLISCVTNARSIPKRFHDLYTGYPIVLADRTVTNLNLDLVTSDNEKRVYDEICRLASMGHRKIGIVYWSKVSTIRARFAGYQKALKESGIEFSQDLVLSTDDLSSLSRERIVRFLEENPGMTAVMLFNNSILSRFLLAMREKGLAIGRDISLISWDDDDLNELMGIDTISQRVGQIGETAVERLFHRIEGDLERDDVLQMTLDTTYIRRSSCVSI